MFFKVDNTSQYLTSSLELIKAFAEMHYPGLPLNKKMLAQLLWLQTNSVSTSQSSVQVKIEPLNIEVKRILSRLNALTLLLEGGTLSYQNFIQAQAGDRVLSELCFTKLSSIIQSLSPSSLQCLMATCFITKSDQAVMAVSPEEKHKLPSDSEQFITYMVTHHPKVFPICDLLSQDAINLLPFAFYRNAHVRHMLDMEGGSNMLLSIAAGISTRAISYEQYNLWFSRWILNIAGLDGHVNPHGSIYLTQPVADCIFALKLELDQLWVNPKHQVLEHYLLFRAAQLDVANHYIGYLGALMRRYTPDEGREIQAWFLSLSDIEKFENKATFERQLAQTKVTPSFKPTVLVNLMNLGCAVQEALTIYIQIESQAMQLYNNAINFGKLADTTPLSFRNIASEKSLRPILDFYQSQHRLPRFEMDRGGFMFVTPQALEDTCDMVTDYSIK